MAYKIILSAVLAAACCVTPAFAALKSRNLLEDKVEILMPSDFTVMPPDILNIRYPMVGNRPVVVFTDSDYVVNVAFKHGEEKLTPEQIPLTLDVMVQGFKNLYPAAEWLFSGVKKINGRDFGVMSVITPTMDGTGVMNLIFFTSYQGRMLMCTFNCTREKMKKWESIGQEIMNSIKIKD